MGLPFLDRQGIDGVFDLHQPLGHGIDIVQIPEIAGGPGRGGDRDRGQEASVGPEPQPIVPPFQARIESRQWFASTKTRSRSSRVRKKLLPVPLKGGRPCRANPRIRSAKALSTRSMGVPVWVPLVK